MAYKSGAKGQSRDIGLNHGPGKGSAPRNNSSQEFRDNHDLIQWRRELPGARKAGHKLVKVYR